MVAAGGIWIEVMRDAAHALAPFGPRTARRLIDRLCASAFCSTACAERHPRLRRARQRLGAILGLGCRPRGEIASIDVNPIVATANGVLALDALVVSKVAVKRAPRPR
jgi:hypothetical protein